MKKKTRERIIEVTFLISLCFLIGIIAYNTWSINNLKQKEYNQNLAELLYDEGLDLNCVEYETHKVLRYNLTCLYGIMLYDIDNGTHEEYYYNEITEFKPERCANGHVVINYTLTEIDENLYCKEYTIKTMPIYDTLWLDNIKITKDGGTIYNG